MWERLLCHPLCQELIKTEWQCWMKWSKHNDLIHPSIHPGRLLKWRWWYYRSGKSIKLPNQIEIWYMSYLSKLKLLIPGCVCMVVCVCVCVCVCVFVCVSLSLSPSLCLLLSLCLSLSLSQALSLSLFQFNLISFWGWHFQTCVCICVRAVLPLSFWPVRLCAHCAHHSYLLHINQSRAKITFPFDFFSFTCSDLCMWS